MSHKRSESVNGPGDDLLGMVVHELASARSQSYFFCWAAVRAGRSFGRLVAKGTVMGVLIGAMVLFIKCWTAVYNSYVFAEVLMTRP